MNKRISFSFDGQLDDLKDNPIYENLIPILVIKTWPEDEDSLFDYGDTCIEEITSSLKLLLINKCKIENTPSQWGILKCRVHEIKKDCTTPLNHLDAWKRLFLNESVKTDCADVLQIKIFLITTFTNATLEQMFSRMNRVKTDFCNYLSIEHLENCLRISEERCAINEINPEHAIKKWYGNKMRRIVNTKPYKYPNKRQRIEGSSSDKVIEIARYILPDFEKVTIMMKNAFRHKHFIFMLTLFAVLVFVYILNFSSFDIMY